MNQEYWDCKALLLRIRSEGHVRWMCGLRIFTSPNEPGQDTYDSCMLAGIEPTDANKTELAYACERLKGLRE